ncbi:MAG TPA: hypothetical protein PKX00_13050 [Opitutaceae bacterium]|nr:hypothetical protein [Opitutaceae bacterium]
MERSTDANGFRTAKLITVDDVPATVTGEHVAELLGSCRRLSDRLDFSHEELWFGEENLV